jgi:hypothetical protein
MSTEISFVLSLSLTSTRWYAVVRSSTWRTGPCLTRDDEFAKLTVYRRKDTVPKLTPVADGITEAQGMVDRLTEVQGYLHWKIEALQSELAEVTEARATALLDLVALQIAAAKGAA